jgi:hypothetical protein
MKSYLSRFGRNWTMNFTTIVIHNAREDEVRALPVPFEVLLERGEVVGALDPSGSPFVLLLDRQGTIVYEGPLDVRRLVGRARALAARGGTKRERLRSRTARTSRHRAAAWTSPSSGSG